MSWESPIKVMCEELQTLYEDNVVKAVQKYNITVKKDELLKALQYDRAQYDKGYADGRADAMKDIVHCKDCSYWTDRMVLVDKDGKPRKKYCLNISAMIDKDFYCGFGDRKDEA